ncbi:TIGR00303 family protein [Synechococcales cyanobacterium C]|uniref:UPF0284 protein GS597_13730 n=1 Tax=Petrachloros mirabilis ULC683 TaxID=2781853 RepID=A0A8K2A930_9CYAN|nr:TIGR00303 family protein [Petrachloros mirabilis]NCJ07550.1 TIGR00303 family protein [Petrachloros mirabilis ULC683]
MIDVYTQKALGEAWLAQYRGVLPEFACVLGFTETGVLPGISAAGATPEARRSTAIADAEFLITGPQAIPRHPLPPLTAGASPVLISRAITAELGIPITLLNAGLPVALPLPSVDLGGQSAQCVTTGEALPLRSVQTLMQKGLAWGEQWAQAHPHRYLILGECVVGGTTTALALLTALGIAAAGKVNSSHPTCNHAQKWQVVQQGLAQTAGVESLMRQPLRAVAAVGDPTQVAIAAIALAVSRTCGVLLAGGTQMLAIYALMEALAEREQIPWVPARIVVGTTRWVVADPTGDAVGLAKLIGGVPLMATALSFAASSHEALRVYEQGFVKEGVGAGGCAIAAHLYQSWGQTQLLAAIDSLWCRTLAVRQSNPEEPKLAPSDPPHHFARPKYQR